MRGYLGAGQLAWVLRDWGQQATDVDLAGFRGESMDESRKGGAMQAAETKPTGPMWAKAQPWPVERRKVVRQEVADMVARRLLDDRERVMMQTRNGWTTTITRMYEDLHRAGFVGLPIKSLGARHVQALVRVWRWGMTMPDGAVVIEPSARETVRANQWPVLRRWVRAIGKNGMVGEFSQAWPAIDVPGSAQTDSSADGDSDTQSDEGQPGQRQADSASAEAKAGAARMMGLKRLGDAQYQGLLARLRGQYGKQRLYWVARVVRELDLSLAEALTLVPAISGQAAGKAVLAVRDIRQGRRGMRAVLLDDAGQVLVEQVRGFMNEARFVKLGWDVSDGGTLDQAIRRTQTALKRAETALAEEVAA